MKTSYDIIIVGAGPVGLWLACELKLARVADVAVIEKRTERTLRSRALTIHGRSLEVFALRGITERFQGGKKIPTGHYAVLDTRLDFSSFKTRFPYALFLPQSVTEEKLEERALELGVHVLRGWNLVDIEDRGDHVHLSTTVIELTASYAVGTDGARSEVRKQAEIAFEGLPACHTIMQDDVVLGAPPSQPLLTRSNEKGLMLVAPLGNGIHHRIVLLDQTRMHLPRTEPLTLEELAESAIRISGEDCQPRDPFWLARFTDEVRLASSYRKGRILLAGDAAHIHPPVGGQGMNVGLQDAMNLGWKLAAVVRGIGPISLLDSYEEERRPVGKRLYANTLAQMALLTHFDAATLALRDMLNNLLRLQEVNHRLAGEISGFDIAYNHEDKANFPNNSLSVGARVPDVDVTLANGNMISLHSLFTQGNWVHLAFHSDAQAPRPAWLPADAVREVVAKVPLDPTIFGNISALLIRPDGYVASVYQPLQIEPHSLFDKHLDDSLTRINIPNS